jgi:hypothetical protein
MSAKKNSVIIVVEDDESTARMKLESGSRRSHANVR